jgi:hypothetical protein
MIVARWSSASFIAACASFSSAVIARYAVAGFPGLFVADRVCVFQGKEGSRCAFITHRRRNLFQ